MIQTKRSAETAGRGLGGIEIDTMDLQQPSITDCEKELAITRLSIVLRQRHVPPVYCEVLADAVEEQMSHPPRALPQY